jgi:uncharacterized secreted protein with C-terminal beta-propeller domain
MTTTPADSCWREWANLRFSCPLGSGSNIQGIEISQNRLLVINLRNTNASYVDLLLYNTTALSHPKLIENESIAGNYIASRLADGYFYAIIQQPSYVFNSEGNATGAMPVLTVNGWTNLMPASLVYYTPIDAQIDYYYTMVVSISLNSGTENTISNSEVMVSSLSNFSTVSTIYLSGS